MNAGLGYGGSCFPKDVKALEHMALVHGSHPSLLRAVIDINRDARRWAVLNLRELVVEIGQYTHWHFGTGL
ncbi:MAG: hypothetical protein R2932_56095 [Caldilineaceae bacterium]